MSKYRAIKTRVDGVLFDSQREAARWCELRLLEKAGHISGLLRQVSLVLAPSVKFAGSARAQPDLRIIVDFQYCDHKTGLVYEDVKSSATMTTAFTIKRHLLLHIHRIQLRITT